jgi:hypothetical protein
MDGPSTNFTHQELSLLLFVLEGEAAQAATANQDPSCETACPIVDNFEALFPDGSVPPEKQLARHLASHLREGLIENGMFEFMAAHQSADQPLDSKERATLSEINGRLAVWSCDVRLDDADRLLLGQSMSRLPRSAWLTMPRTLWRLKKKLRSTPKP